MDCPRLNGLGTVYIIRKTVYKYTLQRITLILTFTSEIFQVSIEIELNKLLLLLFHIELPYGPEVYNIKNLVTKNGSSAIS